MENKGKKVEMPLDTAKLILSQLKTEGTCEEGGCEHGWWMNGRMVAEAVFTGNFSKVSIEESQQFKKTVFRDNDALMLRHLGKPVRNGEWLN